MTKMTCLTISCLFMTAPAVAAIHTNHRYWGNLRAREFCDLSAPGNKFPIEEKIAYAESKYFSIVPGHGESDKSTVLNVENYDDQLICRIEVVEGKVVSVDQKKTDLDTAKPN